MSPYTTDPRVFKRAAKALAHLPGAAPLTACQTALACATGHRDLHHLQALQGKTSVHAPTISAEGQAEIITRLAERTSLPADVLLDALCRTRFFGPDQGFEGALAVRERLYARDFPVMSASSVGAPCQLRTHDGHAVRGLVISRGAHPDGLSYALQDDDIVMRVSHEMPADTSGRFFVPMRFWAPYGWWTEADGSKVIFSRDYCPLWKIVGEDAPVRDDPTRWVSHVQQDWFSPKETLGQPGSGAWNRALKVLEDHRVVSLPALVEWLPKCLKTGEKLSSLKYAARMAELDAHA